MAWNGSGTYTRTNGTNTGSTTWADDAAAGTKITASNHDTHDEDLSTAINACLTKNNETKPTADFVPNADATYDLGSSSAGWLNAYLTGDIVIDERADHAETPAAGKGQIWVKSDTPCIPKFTDDAGTDFDIGIVTTGTFSPTLQDTSESDAEGQSYSTNGGYYTKIGNTVFFSLTIIATAIGTLSGGVFIANLPFTCNNATDADHVCAVYAIGLDTTEGYNVNARVLNNTSKLLVHLWDTTGGPSSLQFSELTTTPTFVATGHYRV